MSKSIPGGVTTKRKKKGWVAETSYIKGSDQTEFEALLELANNLKILAMDIEDYVSDKGYGT